MNILFLALIFAVGAGLGILAARSFRR